MPAATLAAWVPATPPYDQKFRRGARTPGTPPSLTRRDRRLPFARSTCAGLWCQNDQQLSGHWRHPGVDRRSCQSVPLFHRRSRYSRWPCKSCVCSGSGAKCRYEQQLASAQHFAFARQLEGSFASAIMSAVAEYFLSCRKESLCQQLCVIKSSAKFPHRWRLRWFR